MAKQGPKDINRLAFDIVNELTGDEPPKQEPEKDPEAVKRGKSRAAKLTPEQRRDIAKKAAEARWKKR